MKIIKQGKRPQDKEAEFVCRRCKAVVLAKMSEGQHTFDRDGDFVTFVCPCCKYTAHVGVGSFK